SITCSRPLSARGSRALRASAARYRSAAFSSGGATSVPAARARAARVRSDSSTGSLASAARAAAGRPAAPGAAARGRPGCRGGRGGGGGVQAVLRGGRARAGGGECGEHRGEQPPFEAPPGRRARRAADIPGLLLPPPGRLDEQPYPLLGDRLGEKAVHGAVGD